MVTVWSLYQRAKTAVLDLSNIFGVYRRAVSANGTTAKRGNP